MSSVTPGASTPCSNPCTSNFSRAWSMESEHEAIWEESNFQNTPHDLQSNWWTYFSNTTVLVFPFLGLLSLRSGFQWSTALSLFAPTAPRRGFPLLPGKTQARPECSRQPSAHQLAWRLPGFLSGHSLYPNSALFTVSVNRHLFACITDHLEAFRKFIKERPTQITRIMKSGLLMYSAVNTNSWDRNASRAFVASSGLSFKAVLSFTFVNSLIPKIQRNERLLALLQVFPLMPIMLSIVKDLPPRCLVKNLWQNKLVQRHSGVMFLFYDSFVWILFQFPWEVSDMKRDFKEMC